MTYVTLSSYCNFPVIVDKLTKTINPNDLFYLDILIKYSEINEFFACVATEHRIALVIGIVGYSEIYTLLHKTGSFTNLMLATRDSVWSKIPIARKVTSYAYNRRFYIGSSLVGLGVGGYITNNLYSSFPSINPFSTIERLTHIYSKNIPIEIWEVLNAKIGALSGYFFLMGRMIGSSIAGFYTGLRLDLINNITETLKDIKEIYKNIKKLK